MFKIIILGTLFAVLIMSYFISERSKKKSTPPIQKVEDKVEPSIGNVTPIPTTTHEKINVSNRRLNQLLRDRMSDDKIADSFRVARGKMSDEEFNAKWGTQKVS